MGRERSVAGRAAIGVGLLVGFYALVAGVIAATVALNVAITGLIGRPQFYVMLASGLVVLGLLRSVVSLERGQHDDIAGIPATRLEEPGLWALVDETAAAVGTRPPDELVLDDDVNAGVTELGGLLGLRRGRRRLHLGIGLLNVLDVRELRAVLAHEMGHYSGGDTRLGAVTYRGGASIGRAVEHLGVDTLLGRLFGGYAQLYWRITLAVRRRQELSADAAAVRIAGREPFASSLRALEPAAHAYQLLLEQYAAPVWERGAHPADLYGGYRDLLADPERQEQLARILADAEAAGGADRFDSHPSLAERLAAAADLPEGPTASVAPAPARTLLRDAEVTERAMSRQLAAGAMTGDPGVAYEWDQIAAAVYAPALREQAHATMSTLGRMDGTGTPTLRHFLDVVGSDAVLPLAVALTGDVSAVPPEQRTEVQADVMKRRAATVLATAMVDQGKGAWHLTWSGHLEAVDAAGEVVALPDAVDRALDEDALPALRDLLYELGVDERWRPTPPPAPEARPGELLGVVNDLHRAGRRCDLMVFADRFAVVVARLSLVDKLVVGMAAAMGGSARAGGPFRRRCDELVRTPVDELMTRDPRNRTARWSDVVEARVVRRLGGWRLRLVLRDGEVLELRALSGAPPRKAVDEVVRERLAEAGASGVPGAHPVSPLP